MRRIPSISCNAQDIVDRVEFPIYPEYLEFPEYPSYPGTPRIPSTSWNAWDSQHILDWPGYPAHPRISKIPRNIKDRQGFEEFSGHPGMPWTQDIPQYPGKSRKYKNALDTKMAVVSMDDHNTPGCPWWPRMYRIARDPKLGHKDLLRPSRPYRIEGHCILQCSISSGTKVSILLSHLSDPISLQIDRKE
ncbi:unnamed protein product [Nesidiocoris tenuis]|uniref:Uncharacterized protein n=1 Tax=Nesidiocoris tenuis TaxID=355587 RepID=A0A6H5GZ05_9HEMI|nr:unnamed protein product [Nesidiocoris tenuis]